MRGEVSFYNHVRLEIQESEGEESETIYLKNPENDLLAIQVEGDIYELSHRVARNFCGLIERKWKPTFTRVSLVLDDARVLFNNEQIREDVSCVTTRLHESDKLRVDYVPESKNASLTEFLKLIDETFAPLMLKAVEKACADVSRKRARDERELKRSIFVQTHHLTEFENFMKAQGGKRWNEC